MQKIHQHHSSSVWQLGDTSGLPPLPSIPLPPADRMIGDTLSYIYIYIYIYAFSRRFYPKRLTLHSSYSFYILSALAFPGNRTHDLSVASAMLYQLSYRKAMASYLLQRTGPASATFQSSGSLSIISNKDVEGFPSWWRTSPLPDLLNTPSQVCLPHHDTLLPLSHFFHEWERLPGVSLWVLRTVRSGYTLQFG